MVQFQYWPRSSFINVHLEYLDLILTMLIFLMSFLFSHICCGSNVYLGFKIKIKLSYFYRKFIKTYIGILHTRIK